MAAKRVVVIGSNFAGLTAAFDVKRKARDLADVTVVTKDPLFTFIPSLIWVVQGWRRVKHITFPVANAFARKGIKTIIAPVQRVDVERNIVETSKGEVPYDYLVVASGAHLHFNAIPGLGPHGGYTHSICNLPHALEAQLAWLEYLKDPGDIVVGATQGASCFGAGYEFLFNIEYALRKFGLRDQVKITFVTPEPFIGHFGLGGVKGSEKQVRRFMDKYNIEAIPNMTVEEVTSDVVRLGNGRELPYKFAMLIPPFLGPEYVRNSPGLGNAAGWIEVDDHYQHKQHENIYAAGIAVALAPPEPTPVPTGVPKTGYMSEVMGRAAAHNIVAAIKGKKPRPLPTLDITAMCMLDAGDSGIMMMVDGLFGKKRKREILMPGFMMHMGKIAFETYFMWKSRTGRTYLP